jgi:hypothetical protein
MTRRRAARTGFLPVSMLPWSRIAQRTAGMMVASSQVVALRTARMAASAAALAPHDHAEFGLMVQEKLDAASECAAIMGAHAMDQATRGAVGFWARAWQMNVDLALLASSVTPAQAVHRWERVTRHSGETIGRMVSDAAALSAATLAPVHRRATANARRLSRRKTGG